MFVNIDSWIYYFLHKHPGKFFLGCLVGFVLWCVLCSYLTFAEINHVVYIVVSSLFYTAYLFVIGFRSRNYFLFSSLVTFVFLLPLILVGVSYVFSFFEYDTIARIIFNWRFTSIPLILVLVIIVNCIIMTCIDKIEEKRKKTKLETS